MMMMMTRDEKHGDDGQTDRRTNRQTERQKDRWSRMNGSPDRQTNRNTTRSKVMAPSESPYIVSYMSMIKMKSLSVVVFEIFAKIAF